MKLKTHRDIRREYKKNRRKLKRQQIAQIRDAVLKLEEEAKIKNPTYLTWLAEQGALELAREEQEEFERDENNRKWLETEKIAQQEFRERQEKLLQIEVDKAKERIRIQLEVEREQKRIEDIRLQRILLAEERRRRHEMLMEKIDAYINDNAEMPVELHETAQTNPSKELCPFFIKTSSCRFGDRCSRNHVRPGVSKLVLAPNFFNHILLEQNKSTEYGCDTYLEYDNAELYNEFKIFFEDVTSELEKFGKLQHFLVSSNYEPHLRGNVFIEYFEQRDAMKAYRSLRSRFYAGKRINVEFSTINSWNAAICGLSFSKRCPKGKTCNFLHLFKNPGAKYIVQFRKNGGIRSNGTDPSSNQSVVRSIRFENLPLIHRIHSERIVQRTWNDDAHAVSKRNWRWSESPENDLSSTDRLPSCISKSPTYSSNRRSRSPKSPINRKRSRKRSIEPRRTEASPIYQSNSTHNSERRHSSNRSTVSSYRKKSRSRDRDIADRNDSKKSRRSKSHSGSIDNSPKRNSEKRDRSRDRKDREKSSRKRNRSKSSDSNKKHRKKSKKNKKSRSSDRKK